MHCVSSVTSITPIVLPTRFALHAAVSAGERTVAPSTTTALQREFRERRQILDAGQRDGRGRRPVAGSHHGRQAFFDALGFVYGVRGQAGCKQQRARAEQTR